MSLAFLIISADPLIHALCISVFSIPLSFMQKQRRLISLVSDQMYEKKIKNNRMMISILSQIVEFRNGESGSHVVNIKRITELLFR